MTLKHTLPVALAALLAASIPVGSIRSETFLLKNGYEISGAVDETNSTTEILALSVRDSSGAVVGVVRLRRSEVVRQVEIGPPAAGPVRAVAQSELVQVRLKESAVYGKGGIIWGRKAAQSTDDEVVIETPGAGTTRISKDAIAVVEPYRPIGGDATPVPVAADARAIRTTHLLTMKNGRTLRGSVVGATDAALVMVEVGRLGRMEIPQRMIESIEAAEGQIVLPPEEPEAPAGAEQVVPAVDTTSKREPAPPVTEPVRTAQAVDPRLEARILEDLHELTRQRTTNRARAENDLRRVGEPAIAYMGEVTVHPFELTRRAAMRVIRDVGSWEGVPFAIDALLDEDVWVRRIAHEALRGITKRDLGYLPDAGPAQRMEGYRRWRSYLDDLVETWAS